METATIKCDDCGKEFEIELPYDPWTEVLCPACQFWADSAMTFDARWPDDE
jgi:DNA-directed RNA polymerase subunit RPC12/RpoP